MSTADLSQPLNDFERLLLGAREGTVPMSEVLEALLRAQVVLLLDKDPGAEVGASLQQGLSRPLVLNGAQQQPVLAVFSAPERSLPMALQFPLFGFGLPLAFAELLKVLNPGVGLVMNPGTVLGFEMPAAGLARLQQDLLTG